MSEEKTVGGAEKQKICKYCKPEQTTKFVCNPELEKEGCAICIGLQNRDMVNASYINIINILKVIAPQAFPPESKIVKASQPVGKIIQGIFNKK